MPPPVAPPLWSADADSGLAGTWPLRTSSTVVELPFETEVVAGKNSQAAFVGKFSQVNVMTPENEGSEVTPIATNPLSPRLMVSDEGLANRVKAGVTVTVVMSDPVEEEPA